MDTSRLPVAPALTVVQPSNATTNFNTRNEGHASGLIPDPVPPVNATQLPAPIKGLGIAPLDLFLVGDNDDVPLPPEPPRDPIGHIAPLETPEGAPVAVAPSDAESDASTDNGLEDGAATPPALAQAVLVLGDEEAAPTVDVRR